MGFSKLAGKAPDERRKAEFARLDNYKDGQFQNLVHTPPLADGTSMAKVMWKFLGKYPETEPAAPLPSIKTDISNIPLSENVFIWFGHSSYYLQTDGLRFLIDPVFSGSASPLPGSVKAFAGADIYKPIDMPDIDVLLISHDHWDHLDYKTMQALMPRVSKVICGLGVAQHFEYWGWSPDKIIERNWYDHVDLGSGFQVTLTPARHFSGRLFSRNISLWTSFVLQTPSRNLFLGGDSGYGPHFEEIGKRFGPFSLAILECGQYNEQWPYIHSMPEELITQVRELGADKFIPVHHSKFKLAQHPWYEPLQRVTTAAENEGIPIITPLIGQPVSLDDAPKAWPKWWEQTK